jgi:hypothetical protein
VGSVDMEAAARRLVNDVRQPAAGVEHEGRLYTDDVAMLLLGVQDNVDRCIDLQVGAVGYADWRTTGLQQPVAVNWGLTILHQDLVEAGVRYVIYDHTVQYVRTDRDGAYVLRDCASRITGSLLLAR